MPDQTMSKSEALHLPEELQGRMLYHLNSQMDESEKENCTLHIHEKLIWRSHLSRDEWADLFRAKGWVIKNTMYGGFSALSEETAIEWDRVSAKAGLTLFMLVFFLACLIIYSTL